MPRTESSANATHTATIRTSVPTKDFFEVIEVEGVMVRRALVTELADRLIHQGKLETASVLLHGLAHERWINLTAEHRSVLCEVLPEPPVGLEELWRVICARKDDPERLALVDA